MAGTWINRVRHVNDGEAVNGAIDSRPTRALEGNTQYLKDRIDSAELGEGVLAYGETVEAGALVGMPVYRNNVTARYERALAAVEIDPVSGMFMATASSDCVGIIVFKYNATKADILLSGRQLVDISAAVAGASVGAAPAGRYYLSSFTAGMLVQQRPPVSVSVLIYTDDGYAIVQPVMRDFLEDHIHYKVQLYAQPAGTNVTGGGIHTIGSPNPNLPGWLPANHAIFNGRAPTGAAYGYNLSQHPQLARIFPPLPASGAVIFLDRGENYLGGSLVPMGTNGLCSVDSFGIWWMSNCQGDAPWPENWTAPIAELPPNPSTGPECPRLEEFQIILSYTMMVFTTERTTVTSLRPAANSPLVFTNCDGDDATTGDLYAGIDLAFLVDPADNAPGFMAFKTFDAESETFKRGPVVEGLLAGSGCTLSSTNPAPPVNGVVLHQGSVTVNVNTSPAEIELPADLIRLAQTQERFHLDIPYIGFDAGRDTNLRMRFYVPPDGLPTNPAMVGIRMQLIGRSAGTLPALTLSYRILPRPVSTDGLFTPVATNLPGLALETVLGIVTALPIGADQYIEVESGQITVNAGDTILVTLTRNSNDGYGGEVGLMRPVGIMTGTTL
jgi:hypothetical protein